MRGPKDVYVVLTWWRRPGTEVFRIQRATVCHGIGSAKSLRTKNLRYPGTMVSIVPAQLLEGIGEVSEPLTRKQRLVQRFKDLPVRSTKQ